jgi:hypothetical protein
MVGFITIVCLVGLIMGIALGRLVWTSRTPLATMFLFCISNASFWAIVVAATTHKEFDGNALIITLLTAVSHTIGMKISTMRK